MTKDEMIQLQADIKESRALAVEYNASVLAGDVSPKKLRKWNAYLKEIQTRASKWTKYIETDKEL